MRIEKRIFPVLPLYLMNTVVFQILCNPVRAYIGVDVLVENRPNGRGFFLIDFQFPVGKLITVRGKAAVPFSLTRFLNAPLHRLDANIFTFDFRNGG